MLPNNTLQRDASPVGGAPLSLHVGRNHMRALLIAVLALSSNACSADPQFKNAAEFEAVVKSWQLIGKSEKEAMAFLKQQHFECKDHYCYKQTKGLVCSQKLKVDFVLNQETIVQASV